MKATNAFLFNEPKKFTEWEIDLFKSTVINRLFVFMRDLALFYTNAFT